MSDLKTFESVSQGDWVCWHESGVMHYSVVNYVNRLGGVSVIYTNDGPLRHYDSLVEIRKPLPGFVASQDLNEEARKASVGTIGYFLHKIWFNGMLPLIVGALIGALFIPLKLS